MNKVANLQELISLSADNLDQVLGNFQCQLLWEFLHTKQGIKAKGIQKKIKTASLKKDYQYSKNL